ncbi:DUF488 domain-containing protein [Nocardiopsis salina]|uniref:DUF488 domain-containing protein n=1 Tax=Nocardiopsis salina TaxID=245836 RepID=UPI000347FCEF|nr:DUF488 domain-containing protein [Nocardiopsis salina]
MSGTESGTTGGAARGRLFTVGHSNRTLAEFTGLLQEHGVALVVDVRKLPGSARHPQFDEDTLTGTLADLGITLQRAEELTGRRPVSKDVPFEVNAWWQNRSFHNYADHALSEGFAHALALLREWGHAHPTAVMCAEAVWWRCHRRIIADHLLARGEDVFHVLGPGRGEPARLSPGAVVGRGDDGLVTYPGGRPP